VTRAALGIRICVSPSWTGTYSQSYTPGRKPPPMMAAREQLVAKTHCVAA
jgi:hypothetical protein